MPISSGLNHKNIRVGIVLPEDVIQSLNLSWSDDLEIKSSESLDPDASSLSLTLQNGKILVKSGSQDFLCDSYTIACPDAVEALESKQGIQVDPVVAGRGFHWEKRITVHLPGTLTVTPENGGLKLINTLDVESYVACVATSEMGAEAPAALLAAQTIVARCWSLALAEAKHLEAGFDVCNDDCCQRYQGSSFLTDHSLKAAVETKGQVLIYDDAVIDARYSKNCGGMVEDYDTVWEGGPVPYLIPLWDGPQQLSGQAVDDIPALMRYEDAYCSSNRFKGVDLGGMLGKVDVSGSYYRWEKKLSKELLLQNLKKYHGQEWKQLNGIRIMERGPSARIKYLYMDGVNAAGEEISQEVRSEYGIRQMFSDSFLFSSAFLIINLDSLAEDDHVLLQGAGWGHGVGLCQMGALGMALQGIAYSDILSHYYPGTQLTSF